MHAQSWPRLVALLAATAMGAFTTGCKTSGGLASVPGFSWLGRNNQTAAPSLLSSNDPAGQLPPPSAAAEPYQNQPAGPAAGNGYYGSATASTARAGQGQYPSTGYPGSQPLRNAPRNYQTGPYNTGPVNSRDPLNRSSGEGRLASMPSQVPYGSAESSRGGSTPSDAPYDVPDRSGSPEPGADRSVNGQGDRLDNVRTNTQGDSGFAYPREAPAPYGAQPSSYGRDAFDGASTDTYDRASRYSSGGGQASSWDSTTGARNDNRFRQNDTQPAASPSVDPTADALGDRDQSLGQRDPSSADGDRSDYASAETRTSGASAGPLRSSQPWRPGSTSDYNATPNVPDSSGLQQASHLGDLPGGKDEGQRTKDKGITKPRCRANCFQPLLMPLSVAGCFTLFRNSSFLRPSSFVLSSHLPSHHHIRLNHLPGAAQIATGFLHIESNRVNFVPCGLGQAVTGLKTGIPLAREA